MMKNYMIFLAGFALASTGLNAQTNTNTFVVSAPNPVAITQTVVTTTSTATLAVRLVVIDPVKQQITVYFAGLAKPSVISGAAFTTFQSAFQGTFSAAITAYLQANPPTQ
jgi:hypothetical protein